MCPQQLDLTFAHESYVESLWRKLKGIITSVSDTVGPKEMASRCDAAPSNYSHALSERNGFALHWRWSIPFALSAPNDDLAEFYAGLRGRTLGPHVETMPAEERLRRIERALEESLSPEMRRALMQKAFGPGVKP